MPDPTRDANSHNASLHPASLQREVSTDDKLRNCCLMTRLCCGTAGMTASVTARDVGSWTEPLQSTHQHHTLNDIDDPSKQVSLGEGTGDCPAYWRLLSIPAPPVNSQSNSLLLCRAHQRVLAPSCLSRDSCPPETWSYLKALAAHDHSWQDAKRASADLFLDESVLLFILSWTPSPSALTISLGHTPRESLEEPCVAGSLVFIP